MQLIRGRKIGVGNVFKVSFKSHSLLLRGARTIYLLGNLDNQTICCGRLGVGGTDTDRLGGLGVGRRKV